MLAHLLDRLDRHWIVTQAVVLLAVLASCYFVTRLKVLDSPERWMPKSTSDAWEAFEEHFDAGDNVGIGLHFQRPVSEDDLPRLTALRKRLEAVRGINRVYDCSLVAKEIERVPLLPLINSNQLAEKARAEAKQLEEQLAGGGDPLLLQNKLRAAWQELDKAERLKLYNGALWDSPAAGDPTRMLMTVCELEYHPGEEKSDSDGLNARRRHVVNEINRILAEEKKLEYWRGVEFHAAGGIMMMGEMEKRTRQVAFRFLPLSVLVGLVTLLLGFRSLRALAVALLGSGVAVLLVLGWLGAGGGTLGVVTMAAPTLISVIATASTIHFAAYAAFRHGKRNRPAQGDSPKNRRLLVRWVCVPCLGAATTTGVGFLMLGFNELAPIRDLGMQMFAGSLLAFLGVFVLSQLIPIRSAHTGSFITPGLLRDISGRSSVFPITAVAMTAVVLATLCFLAWPRPKESRIGLHVDADPFSFFSDKQPIKIALNRFSQREFAVYQLDVVLVPRRQGKVAQGLDPPDGQSLANRDAAEAFAAQVESRRDLGVVRVLSTLAFQKRYEQFLEEMYHTYQRRGALAAVASFGAYSSSANMLSHSFRSWNVDKKNEGALRFTFVVQQREEGFEPLVDFVKGVLPHDEFHCYLAGSVAQTVDLSKGLGKGMVWGLGSSLAVMGVLCVFLFRSLRLALIAFVPNIFPVLVIFGVMGAVKMPISSGSAMVATIALGIALNDTIHFMLHYQQQTRQGRVPTRQAVAETVQHVGRPIVMTSLVHVAGFAIFLTTDFLPLFHFGLLASIAMLAALVGDLVLLPNLLLVFDRDGQAGRAAASNGENENGTDQDAI